MVLTTNIFYLHIKDQQLVVTQKKIMLEGVSRALTVKESQSFLPTLKLGGGGFLFLKFG